MPRSDSSSTYAWGLRLAPSPTGLLFAAGVAEASRFSCREFPGVRGFPRPRRAPAPLAETRRWMWPSPSVHRVGARNSGFRGSIAGPPVPLSTLHPRCRHRRRMTRGQRGSLLLRCGALSSPTPCRFIPALSDSLNFCHSAAANRGSVQRSAVMEKDFRRFSAGGKHEPAQRRETASNYASYCIQKDYSQTKRSLPRKIEAVPVFCAGKSRLSRFFRGCPGFSGFPVFCEATPRIGPS